MYSLWHSINSKQSLKGKNVLVVGGTQGIGAGVATRFVQLGASVSIAGRNESLALDLIQKWKAIQNEGQEFNFFRVDASLVQDVSRFGEETKEFYQKRGGLDYLVQSQGILTTAANETREGLDYHFALTAFSKWLITKKLLPVLKGSCIYILSPSTRGEIDLNDVQFRNKSFLQRFHKNPVFVDAITIEFQKQNPSLHFYHLYPGIVKTDLLHNSGFNSFMRFTFRGIGKLLGRDPIEYADHPVFVATHPDEIKGSRLDDKGKEFPSYPWIESEENRAKLFDWCNAQEANLVKS